ncbi:hypothetical protein [Enemella sp. A6]|uniref:hypothetical protein n=1 Tax=Enemella sp. A6 TaxID=3440152 RepID=UPI003EB805AC
MPIVLAALGGVIVLALVWFLAVPALFPSMGRDPLVEEAEKLAAALGDSEVRVADDEYGYRVIVLVEFTPGPDYTARTEQINDELFGRGWLPRPGRPELIDADLNTYRYKVVGGRVAYATAITGVHPVEKDELPETGHIAVKFSHDSGD